MAVIRNYLRTADLIGQANIYAEFQRQSSRNVYTVGSDGKFVQGGPVTEVESMDEIYLTSVEGAIEGVVWDEAATLGFPNANGSDLWFSAQPDCPGANLGASVTW